MLGLFVCFIGLLALMIIIYKLVGFDDFFFGLKLLNLTFCFLF